MASKFNQSYFRFLELVNLIADIKPSIALDKVEILLLDHIALALSQNTDLFVKDLITLSTIGSLATLHNRLKNLVALGFIRLIADDQDNRKKHVVLTAKAGKYYENLSLHESSAAIFPRVQNLDFRRSNPV